MRLLIQSLFIFSLLLLIFPGFCFFVGNLFYPVFYLFLPIIIVTCFLIYKKPLSILKYYYLKTPFKYFTYLILWIMISGGVAVLCGYYSIKRYLYVIIFGLFLRAVATYLLPLFIFYKEQKLIKFIRFLVTGFYIIFVIGIIEFIGVKFNISIINYFMSFISNTREGLIIDAISSTARIRSTFPEPSHLACFIVCFLPLIYKIATAPYAIFKNSIVNYILKKALVPLSLLNLLLTQSPIFFVFGIIVSSIYIYINTSKKNKKKIALSVLVVTCFSLLLAFFLKDINVSQTFLIRIVKVVQTLTNWDNFIIAEPSLAARIVCYITQLNIFMHYPLVGVGFGNRGYIVLSYFESSPLTLPAEVLINLYNNASDMRYNQNCVTQLLHQTGFIGFLSYIVLMFKNIIELNKIKKFFTGIEKTFVSGYIYFLVTALCISFYNLGFMTSWFLFAIGYSCVITIIGKKRIKKCIKIQDSNNFSQ